MEKEFGGEGRYCITGVRWAESARRKQRAMHEVYAKKKQNRVYLNNDNDARRKMSEICMSRQKYMLNPIIDWTDNDVWDFLKIRGVPINPLYERGYKRIGCIGCPMSGKKRIKEFENNPKYYESYKRAIHKHFEYRQLRGLSCEGIYTNEDVYMNWWLENGTQNAQQV
jgi:phosphoadenosine phosphosulfate reductase